MPGICQEREQRSHLIHRSLPAVFWFCFDFYRIYPGFVVEYGCVSLVYLHGTNGIRGSPLKARPNPESREVPSSSRIAVPSGTASRHLPGAGAGWSYFGQLSACPCCCLCSLILVTKPAQIMLKLNSTRLNPTGLD